MDRRFRVPAALAFFLAVATFLVFATPQHSSAGNGVLFTFDGAPPSPVPFNPSDWDIAVSSRDASTYYSLESMQAVHGNDCNPDSTHTVTAYTDSVFQCKDHVMTAINAGGYGIIYLTPNQLVDWSTGETVVKFDMSTFRTSARDFVSVWLTPMQYNQQLPLDDWLPDLQGEPREAIQIRMDGGLGSTHFRGNVIKNFKTTDLNSKWWVSYESKLTPDKKRRDTFELRISPTHIKFGMPQYNLWWIDQDINLGWNQGILQIGHHSYNPFKDGNNGPNTWHFDNVGISNAIPFQMLKGDRRFVDQSNQTVRFNGAAPANSHLRFSGVGKILVSFDGGSTWQAATKQQQELNKVEHFSSYWMPVPAGTTSVTIKGGADSWYTKWMAKDFAIWGPAGSATTAPAPTNTPQPPPPPPPTSTPTKAAPTPTKAAPTAVPTKAPPQPTATPTQPPVGNKPQPITQTGSRVKWQGKDWYINGVNMPWYNWACDFGCNANGGVSSNSVKSAINTKFATLKSSDVHNVRWWMFPGDPWQITRDSSGAPSGLNSAIYADIDAALALAEANDLYYNFTLFSGPSALPSSWITNATNRQKLADVLGTLFARYANHPRILTWEIVNEPEFDIWSNKVTQSDMQDFVRKIAASVRANTNANVTVGSAMVDGLPIWKGLGLSYYDAHWYDYMSPGNWCAYCTTASEIRTRYGLEGPIVIGEFYGDTSVATRWQGWYDKGFAGAYGWSLFSEKTGDGMKVSLTAASGLASNVSDDGPRVSTGGPTPPAPTATPVPPTPVPPTQVPPTSTPTKVPTQAPQPTATPTKSPSKDGSWLMQATVNPGTVNRGSSVTFNIATKAPAAGSYLVDFEVYDAAGKKVYQKWWDKSTYRMTQVREMSDVWVVPASLPAGTYTVKIGIFGAGWNGLVAWNDSAAKLTVK